MSSQSAAPAFRPEKVTAPALQRMKRKGQRITMLTAYDASFARLLDDAGVDALLVGDSLGMVIQGQSNTLSVTLDQVIYHAQAVARGVERAHVVADMPFMTYQASLKEGLINAGRLVKEGGAEGVKIEGGERNAELVKRITEVGIPVMGHIGLTPQSVNALGGFKVQGKAKDDARRLLHDALSLQQAGAYAVVLESIPRELASQLTAALDIPTIGIGAGAGCDGQVLVSYDLLGMDSGFSPKFVKRYETLGDRIGKAVKQFIREVENGLFPSEEHSFGSRTRTIALTTSNEEEQKEGSQVKESEAVSDGGAETIPLYPGGRRK